MPTYVALLRGINLGGHKKIKMDHLRGCFEQLGCEDVRTYIQSGNVIFRIGGLSPAAWSRKAEEKILRDFGFSAPVILRTAAELGKTIQGNPFAKNQGIAPAQLHVFFLSATPAQTALQELQALQLGTAQLRSRGREFYLHTPDGFGRTKLPNFDKMLSVTVTARNWNTVNKLHELASQ